MFKEQMRWQWSLRQSRHLSKCLQGWIVTVVEQVYCFNTWAFVKWTPAAVGHTFMTNLNYFKGIESPVFQSLCVCVTCDQKSEKWQFSAAAMWQMLLPHLCTHSIWSPNINKTAFIFIWMVKYGSTAEDPVVWKYSFKYLHILYTSVR